ncbi:trypsin-like serine protease [Vibrio scophthalmi]|uniref:Trypsin protease n=1 Tax=Vibrio scophthalmi LMG 19158 TaxID=870967 RepID=F9RN60_9VIBR|nr:trypsin-like serine protease [Vibrio scophthalmi]EGU37415.1 trypsin protease precursor [Vibrio scophthalmi LMG 19158]
MKKALLLLALSSPSAMAIVGGESLDWRNQFTNMTTLNCSYTVIGGKFLLTAGHCVAASNIGFSNSENINILTHILPPDDGTELFSPDIAVWELERAHKTKDISYIANLNSDPIRVGDSVNMYGFGGSDQLRKGISQVADRSDSEHDLSSYYVTNNIGQGLLQPGDSGGAWTNTAGEIIGVSSSVAPDSTSMMATRLPPLKDWLSQTVNAWHYPTLANVNGRETITIQSLHSNPAGVDFSVESNETGDATIIRDQSTCLTKPTVLPFEKCTIVVESNGGEGQIQLSGTEFIELNKPTPVEPPTPPSAGGGSSGGSMSLFGLLGLFGLGVMRSRKR